MIINLKKSKCSEYIQINYFLLKAVNINCITLYGASCKHVTAKGSRNSSVKYSKVLLKSSSNEKRF